MARRCFQNSPIEVGQLLELNEEGHHHVTQVLRLRTGAPIELFNGDGLAYSGVIVKSTRKHTTVEVESSTTRPLDAPFKTHLALSLIARDKWSLALQKATELGVSEITPLMTARTTYKLPKEKQAQKHTHWSQIIQNACEQCGRNTLPKLNTIDTFSTFSPHDAVWMLDPHEGEPIPQDFEGSSLSVLIGPEGGFTDEERSHAKNKGARLVSLGPRILRAETAPVALLSILGFLKGDLG